MDQICEVAAGQLAVSGVINLENVSVLRDKGFEHIDQASREIEVDLSSIDVQGLSTVALLLSWTAYAARQNKQLSFIFADEKLHKMAEVSGVVDIINFK